MALKSNPVTSSQIPWRKAFCMEREDNVDQLLIIQNKMVTSTWNLITTLRRRSFGKSWQTINRSCRRHLSIHSHVKQSRARDSITAHSTTRWTWLVQLVKTSCPRRRYHLQHQICTMMILPSDPMVQTQIINESMTHLSHIQNGKDVHLMKSKENHHLQMMHHQSSEWLTMSSIRQLPPSRRMWGTLNHHIRNSSENEEMDRMNRN